MTTRPVLGTHGEAVAAAHGGALQEPLTAPGDAGRWYGRQVSQMGTATSSFNVSVPTSGVAWGSHSGIQVYSFLRHGNVSSGTVDIRAISQWPVNSGRMPNVTIGNVQFGFEITSSSGGRDFIVNSYSTSLS